jgi:hypothetical protein
MKLHCGGLDSFQNDQTEIMCLRSRLGNRNNTYIRIFNYSLETRSLNSFLFQLILFLDSIKLIVNMKMRIKYVLQSGDTTF